MKIIGGDTRLFRIELAIVVMVMVALIAMSGTAAAAANSASVSASPMVVEINDYTVVTGEIDLQALFFCGGYTLETHLADELNRPTVMSTNAGSGSLTIGYSDAINERAWRWDSGFGGYCGSPTKRVKLLTSPDESGFHELGAGSDYFHPSKWEQARIYSDGFW
ncbi:MAG: hypothetical protein ABEH88_08275 [Halobacteriales archaeon]